MDDPRAEPEARDAVLVFDVDGRRHALPAGRIREVLRAVALVPLPGAPAVVEGVFDLRGAIVPAFDIRARFRLPPRPVAPADHLVVAGARGRTVALRVDRVLGLAPLASDQVAAAKPLALGVERISGVARLPDGLALIHDLDAFLDEAEVATLERALAAAPAAAAVAEAESESESEAP